MIQTGSVVNASLSICASYDHASSECCSAKVVIRLDWAFIVTGIARYPLNLSASTIILRCKQLGLCISTTLSKFQNRAVTAQS